MSTAQLLIGCFIGAAVAEVPLNVPGIEQRAQRMSNIRYPPVNNKCSCLNWAFTYKTLSDLCGRGYEWGAPAGKFYNDFQTALASPGATLNSGADAAIDIKMRELNPNFDSIRNCYSVQDADHDPMTGWHRQSEGFFPAQNHAYCINHAPGSSTSWCYVSSDCTELNGGQQITGLERMGDGEPHASQEMQVSVKNCVEGVDPMLRDLSPLELSNMLWRMPGADRNGNGWYPMSLGAKMAYSTDGHYVRVSNTRGEFYQPRARLVLPSERQAAHCERMSDCVLVAYDDQYWVFGTSPMVPTCIENCTHGIDNVQEEIFSL